MPKDTTTENLIINRLTRAQYNSIVDPSPTELYVITDEDGTIGSLSDVNISSVANDQILKYNSTTQKWENSTLTTSLAEDSDVVLTTPANEQALVYDSTTQKWKNADTFVKKAGDTMTGILNIHRPSGSNFLTVRIGDLDWGAPQTELRTLSPMQLEDKTGAWFGKFQVQFMKGGGHKMEFSVRKSATQNLYSKISAGWDASGNSYSEFAPTKCCDGQWISINSTLISSSTTIAATTTNTYTISALAAGSAYEVLVSATGYTGDVVNDQAKIGIGSSIVSEINNTVAFTQCMVTGVKGAWAASCVIPVSSDRSIKIRQNSSVACTCDSLKIVAYRRIGTNT